MITQNFSIDKLIPYENNPRINDRAVAAVANSIKEFGFKVPIIIDKNNVIVAGHTRLKAAQKLGLKEVPVTVADDLSEEQIKAFRLADNKAAELAEWDFEKLEQELAQIDMDMSAFDFDIKDLEKEFNKNKEVEEDENFDVDAAIEEIEEPKSKTGDIYKLGEHRLMCGDSTKKEDIEKLMNGATVDLFLTDPPYNAAIKNSQGMTIQNDDMENNEFKELLIAAFKNAFAAMKEGAAFYIWYTSREHINFETALNEAGLTVREQLIWNKNSLILGSQDYQWKHEPCLYGWKEGASHNWYSDRSQTTVMDFNKPNRNGEHPTMKPLELIGYQIKNSSKQSDTVLDLFGGSGTTLIACEQLNRRCYMMELDPKYVDVIITRWETLTGEKAVKIS